MIAKKEKRNFFTS